MNRLNRCVVIFLLGSQLFPFSGGQDSPSVANKAAEYQVFTHSVIKAPKKTNQEGYKAVIPYEDGFLAAGSGGRIDRISSSGEITKSVTFPGENFNSLAYLGEAVIAGGNNGALMISSDNGLFRKVESGTNSNINSLTVFNGRIIAGGDHGEIITSEGRDSFEKIKPGLKGNIVSFSARKSACYGVTDEGEIVHSVDGIKWDIMDFNQVYSGFYKPCYFTKVLVTENRIAITGLRDDGSPVLMFSNQGRVWTERHLNYTNEQGFTDFLTGIPNDIFYDKPEDCYYLACSDGKLLKLPACSHCNKLEVLCRENLEGISLRKNTLMAVGENFIIKTIDIR